MVTQPDPSVITVPLGEAAFSALASTIADVQADDPFKRVVVITVDRDVAREVLHLLGARGLINVTVQTGERLAAELARPILHPVDGDEEQPLQPLKRLDESQAVRRVAEEWLAKGSLALSAAGRLKLQAELINGFQQLERRAEALDDAPPAGDAILNWVELYDKFRLLLQQRRFYTRYQLPGLAAQSVSEHWPDDELPTVIYYLPRHPLAGELQLMQTLLARQKGRVIVGLTGDEAADAPAKDLLRRMGRDDEGPIDSPLAQAAADGRLCIVVAPDPGEEARVVVRRIVAMADGVPFHRIAVVHRQDAPYASLLRQELDFAGIPNSGAPRRSLADTPAGRFLLGILGLVVEMGVDDDPGVDRELWIELITAVPMRLSPGAGDPYAGSAEVPATRWANLARAARANGTVQQWTNRLRAYVMQQERREIERYGERVASGGAVAGTGNQDGTPWSVSSMDWRGGSNLYAEPGTFPGNLRRNC